MKSRSRTKMLPVLLVIVGSCLPICSQTPTGQLTGLVTDSRGAVIPEAQVSVVNIETSVERRTASGSQGYYTVPLL